jgi:hypothetical protein
MPEWKVCSNCKYKERSNSQVPCENCIGVEPYFYWKPKSEDAPKPKELDLNTIKACEVLASIVVSDAEERFQVLAWSAIEQLLGLKETPL